MYVCTMYICMFGMCVCVLCRASSRSGAISVGETLPV